MGPRGRRTSLHSALRGIFALARPWEAMDPHSAKAIGGSVGKEGRVCRSARQRRHRWTGSAPAERVRRRRSGRRHLGREPEVGENLPDDGRVLYTAAAVIVFDEEPM